MWCIVAAFSQAAAPADVQCVSARMLGGLGSGTQFADQTQQWAELPSYPGRLGGRRRRG